MKRLLPVLLLGLMVTGCAGLINIPGGGPPTPPPPADEHKPVCHVDVDRVCDCWHNPPGQGWQKTPPCAPAPTPSPEPNDTLPATTGGDVAPPEGQATPDPTYATDVDEAIRVACGGCLAGTKLIDWRAHLSAVRSVLKGKGYQSNYDYDHGDLDAPPPKGTGLRYDSELSIWKGCRVESYQLVTSARTVRRPPGAFRSWATVKDCQVTSKVPPPEKWETEVKPHGGQILDTSPKAFWFEVPPPCPPVNECGAHGSLLTFEKGNLSFAQLWYGAPVFRVKTDHDGNPLKWQGLSIITPINDNPYMVKIQEGEGELEVCGSVATPASCVKVYVARGTPPCDVVKEGPSTGHCVQEGS